MTSTVNKRASSQQGIDAICLGAATMYVGKLAAIKDYIHPLKQPVLVSGDSPNDHWMISYADPGKDGLKLWVNRKEKYWTQTQAAFTKRAEQQRELGRNVIANQNWMMVRPADIGVE